MMTHSKTALQELGMQSTVEKVTDFAEIAKHGVMSIPALVIDERVVSSGKILKPKEIAKILEDAIK